MASSSEMRWVSQWIVDMMSMDSEEEDAQQMALLGIDRTPFAMSVRFFIFYEWEGIPTDPLILGDFVETCLGIPNGTVTRVTSQKHPTQDPTKGYLQVFARFQTPIKMTKQPGLFKATFSPTWTSYTCRLEQVPIDRFLLISSYNEIRHLEDLAGRI